jgi:metal-responsive CopG/Arc/MetJ family transcriptional regulator
MDDQLTFRIPKELARVLNRSARERGVPRSQLVREALREYLGHRSAAPDRATILKRLEAYRGITALDPAAIEADPIARQIYEHNWRE